MIENERQVEAFDQEHDHGDGRVVAGNRVFFSDGAQRSVGPFGLIGFEFGQPPSDPKALLGLQKQFWEIRLEALVEQFEDLHHRCKTLAKSDGARFRERMEELKGLQTQVRSARSKLAHLVTEEKGYCQADVQRAWETWQEFSEAAAEESRASEKFHSAMRGKSSAGVLEKLKRAYDEAKAASTRAMERWNNFTPTTARSLVCEQLDAEARQRREHELDEIEV